MHKPELLADFNDLVHKTINRLEDDVTKLRAEIVALKERLNRLEGSPSKGTFVK